MAVVRDLVRSLTRPLVRGPLGSQSGGGSAPVLSNFVDDLAEPVPYVAFDCDQSGTGYWDFHSSATPPAAGAGDIATDTFAASPGTIEPTIDLSAYPGETGYLHFRVVNGNGTSNILTSQVITVPGAGTRFMENATLRYLEDGTARNLEG
jgi:hypothetical protein